MGFRTISGSENRYLRMGVYGKPGAGKTRTATEVAIGLARDTGKHGVIAFIDTEGNGSDYMAPIIEGAGLTLIGAKTKDFRELLELMNEAEEAADVLIIDSVSHFWDNLRKAYLQEKRQEYLELKDWGVIKGKWSAFVDRFLSLQMHEIVTGRSGKTYDRQKNEKGKWEMVESGTKMKAEGEFAHEPSLVIEMELDRLDDGRFLHRAIVLKDRSDHMNGAVVENPTFASFEPIIRDLAPNGNHIALDESKQNGVLFGSPELQRIRDKARKASLADRVSKAFDLHGLSSSTVDKQRKAELLKECFGNPNGKEAFNALDVMSLEVGVANLERMLGGVSP